MSVTSAPTCARHPKTVTYLRCSSCNTPICPDCFVETPVGHKCQNCGRIKNPALTTPTPFQAASIIGVGIVAGVLASAIASAISIFSLWLAFYAGRYLGKLLMHVSGHKMGRVIETLAAGSILLGGIGLRVGIWLYKQPIITKMQQIQADVPNDAGFDAWMIYGAIIDPISIIAVIIVAVSAVKIIRG